MNYIVILLSIFAFAASQSAEEKGLEIATAMDKSDTGFGDSQSSLKMTLKNSAGQESIRFMRNKTLEGTTDGDKSMIIFDKPTMSKVRQRLLLLTKKVRMISGCICQQ